MKQVREKRLNSELQKLIYEILTTKIRNPEITEMFSISSVSVSNDLENADVYVSVFSTMPNRSEKTFQAICDSASAVRKELGKIMRIRYVPLLRFKLDTSAEYGEKIEKIISTFTYGDDNDNK